MSKVSEAVQPREIPGNQPHRPAAPGPVNVDTFVIKEDFREDYTFNQVLYRIEMRVGNEMWIDNSLRNKYEASLEEAVNITRKGVIEEIFGEFRPFFHKIEKAIFNNNSEEARILLSKMYNQMFNI